MYICSIFNVEIICYCYYPFLLLVIQCEFMTLLLFFNFNLIFLDQMNITGLFNTAAITSEINIVLSKLFALLKCPCVKFMESHMYNKPMQANTVPMNKTTRIAKIRCLLINLFILNLSKYKNTYLN